MHTYAECECVHTYIHIYIHMLSKESVAVIIADMSHSSVRAWILIGACLSVHAHNLLFEYM